MNDLLKFLTTFNAKPKETNVSRNLRLETSSRTFNSVKDHSACLEGVQLAAKMFALLTLAYRGKTKDPICQYDGNLQFLLNKKGFFSTNIGMHFLNQEAFVLKDLEKNHNGTFLFIDKYAIQKADWRPRLWAVSIEKISSFFNCTVTFGHCQLLPMLPYEIIGVCVVVQSIAETLGVNNINYVWNFHSVATKSTNSIVPVQNMFSKLPKRPELAEFLLIEEQLRGGKRRSHPVSRIPFSDELDLLMEEVFKYWVKVPEQNDVIEEVEEAEEVEEEETENA